MTDDQVLGDHRWERSTLIPPLVDSVDDSLQLVRWARQRLPDFVWIAILYRELGGSRTIDVLVEVAESAKEVQDGVDFLLLSEFSNLTDEEMSDLQDSLPEDVITDLESALEPLFAYYPSCPLLPLIDSVPDPEDEHLGYLAVIVDELSNRRSRLATHVQGLYIGSLMATGGISIHPESPLADINEVFRYPDTEYSEELGSIVRASTKAMNSTLEEEESHDVWVLNFWQRGFEISECKFPQELLDDDAQEKKDSQKELYLELAAIGAEYDEELRKKILSLWWDAEFDAEFTGKHEVLDGLLLRQVNLATTLSRTPEMWSQDTSTILLRSMSENHIVLEWLNQNGEIEHYQDYIEHGLGQEKLFLEHSERVVGDSGDERAEELFNGMNGLESQLEAQRARYLLPVNVGHWTNKNTRELAQEANLKDFYDMRFQQYSASVHGQWNSVYKQNLVTCRNPLHQYHKIPEFRPVQTNPIAIVEAGNIMNRSFQSWVEARQISVDDPQIPDLAETVKEVLDVEF